MKITNKKCVNAVFKVVAQYLLYSEKMTKLQCLSMKDHNPTLLKHLLKESA